MTLGDTYGWTCSCGTFVGMNQSHTCITASGGTVPPIAPFPTYSAKPVRYRIHGEIGSQSGRTYQVDLVIEAMP